MTKEQELIRNYKLIVDRLYYLAGKEILNKADYADALQRQLDTKDADIQKSSTSTDDSTSE